MPGRRDFTLTMGLEGAATIVTGLNQLIQLVGRVVARVQEAAQEVHEYSSVVDGHAVSIDQARQATAGLIGTIELHRGAAQLEAAGIRVTAEQLRGLSVAAADYAQRTGREMNEVFNEFIRAVQTGEEGALARLGVTLKQNTTRAQRQTQAIEDMTERFGDQTIAAQDLHEQITSLQGAWSDAWNEMALAVQSSSGVIQEVVAAITDGLRDVANALETQREAAASLRTMGITGRMVEVQRALESRGMRIGEAGQWEAGEAGTGRVVWDILRGQSAAETGAEIRSLLDEYRRLQAQEQEDIRTRGVRPGGQPGRAAPLAREPESRGGGRRRAPPPLGEYLSGPMTWLFEDIERRSAEFADRQERIIQTDIDRWRKRTDDLTVFFETLDQQQQTSADLFAQAEEAKRLAIEQTTSAMEAQAKSAERAVSTFETISSVTQSLGGVMDQVSGIITAAAGEDEKTVERMKKVRGAFLIAEAVVQAALEAARAAASFAEQDYSGGAMHVIAAAMYAAAAVKAGVEMGASPKTGASGASSRAYPEHRGGESGRRSEPQPMVVNINGPVTSRRVQEDLVEMQRGGARAYG
jgi:hypothetical protein